MIVDGKYLEFPYTLLDGARAIIWDGTKGQIEYPAIDGEQRVNTEITAESDIQWAIDLFDVEVARLAQKVIDDDATEAARLKTVEELREVRDELLASSDFTQLPDVHSATMRATWATYRQELRDLPAGYTPVADPVYPTKP